MPIHTLIRIDTNPIAEDHAEIRAFMTVRDEMLRLPRTFDHYRRLGVSRFFVIDNGSTDGSKEFLLAQPHCHVFVTYDSYGESGYGVAWQNALLNAYGTDHWCLVVDADEWFVYPGYETHPLDELAAHLERTGAQGVFAFMLDMYGPGTIADAISEPERSLLDACRYFDSRYAWHRKPRIPGIEPPRFPEFDVFGGPRLRLLFPHLQHYYHLIRTVWRTLDFVPLPLPGAFQTPPKLTKIPFVRWLPGTRYQHPHATTPIKLSEVTGILLHFKFLQDFYARVVDEVNRKEHWKGASEYTRYLAKLRKNPSLSLHYDGSVAYEDSGQLVRLGLLREDEEWRRVRTENSDLGAGSDQRDWRRRAKTFPSDTAAAADPVVQSNHSGAPVRHAFKG